MNLAERVIRKADRVSLALQALQNQRRVEQRVEVTFSDRQLADAPGVAPRTPDQISPPAPRQPPPSQFPR